MKLLNLNSDRKAVHRGLIDRQKRLLMVIGILTLLFTLAGYGKAQAHAAVAIAAGGNHTCAVLADGTVECWGNNDYGQLGDGTTTYRSTPVAVSGITTSVSIAAGESHTCAVLADGTVRCWGYNISGQLGDGTTTTQTTPVAVSGITTAVAIAAGLYHTCAVLVDGTAKCWGFNGDGELGDGTTTDQITPVAVSGISSAVAITAKLYHTCAVLADGTAKCWGNNTWGQLGDGTTTTRTTPVAVSGISTAVAIAAGISHTCAVLADGTAKCWGYNFRGQLGDGTTTTRTTPVAVSGITTAVSIAVGYNHTCAVLADGTAKCWGYNFRGQLGDGTTTTRTTPVAVSGITTAVSIAVGYDHTCTVLADGSAKCWGYNIFGQLGDGTTGSSTTPVVVSGITMVVSIATGGYHTCAMLADGTVKCWGWNGGGQIGDGTTTYRTTPVAVSGISTAVAIAAGYGHTCAVLADGTVKCWGYNSYGQLGDGTTTNRYTPVTVSGITTAAAITAGEYHTCAVLTDGTVKCWGYNGFGGIGDGTTTNRSTPVAISGITTALAIAAGYGHTCAVMADGTARCWGYNVFGQLGDGTTTNRTTPVVVSGINTAVKITAGYEHTCVVLADRSAKCWGDNGFGKLGDGTTSTRTTPVTVSGITTAVAIEAGNSHTCAVLADGTVKCWGYNNYGQLGDGTTTYRTTPVMVSGISTGTAITAGESHTCAVLADGSAQCWGYNNYGQLARPYYSATPVTVLFDLFLSYSSETGYGSDGVNPDTGNSSTSYTYKVVYTDAHNTAPTYTRVHIDGNTIGLAMSLDTSAVSTLHDGDYTNGEQYFYATTLGAGSHNYYFTASNGTEIEGLPFSGALSGPTVSSLTITTTTLFDGTVGLAYSSTLSASGGTPPYTWSIPSGLPPGLTLNTSTGGISGTPTTAGIYGFTASVTDSAPDTISKVLSISINANQPPVANNHAVSTAEDTSVATTLTGSDPDGDPLSFSVFSGPSNGTLSGTAPNLTYTPNANFNGSDSFTFRVNDGLHNSNIATVSITVTAVNDPPVLASIGNRSVAEGATLNVGVSASDVDGTIPTLSATGLPAFCSFTDNLNGTGTLTCTSGFTDANTYTGLTVTASDGSLTDSETFSLTVNDVNRAPVLNPIGNQTVAEGGTLSVSVTASDPDGNAVTLTASSLPSFCGFTDNLNNTGTLTCTPGFTDSGLYTGLTITTSDGFLADSETFSLTVGSVNRAPVVNSIPAQSVNEGNTLNVPVTASDPDGDPVTLTASNLTTFCSFTDNGGGSGTVSCTPGFDDGGVYVNLTVTAGDGTLTGSASFNLTVNGVNRAPTVSPIANQTVAEGGVLNLSVTASDLDGDFLTLSAIGLPGFCSFTDHLNNTGTLTCTPGYTDAGSYPGLTMTANDGMGGTGSASFTLTVTGVNRAPVMNPIADQAVNEGSVLNLLVSGSDPDGGTVTLAASGLPAFCSFTDHLNNTGTLTCSPGYTNAGTYPGLTVTASDGSLTGSAAFSLTVNNVNGPPTLNPIGNQLAVEGTTLNVTVTASDPDGGSLTFTATGLPGFCGFTDNVNNTATLTCTPGYTNAGTYPGLTVTVTDGSLSDSETFTLTVSGANAAPVLSPIGNQNMAEGAILNVTITASDADGDTLTFAASGLPGFCGLTDHLNNTATLTCSPGFADAGVYSGLVVTVNDGIAGDSEGFTLTVSNVNRPPTLSPIGNQTVDEGAILNVTVTTSDPDGGLLTFGATGLPGFCSFSDNLNNTGTFSCSPGFSDAGVYSGITIIVNDGALTDSETFSLTVTGVNRAPVVSPIADQSVNEGATLNVPVTASDPDGNAVTLTATGLPGFCSFTDHLNNTGTVTCAPGFNDGGVYIGLTVTASDEALTGSDSFNLTVNGVNRAPVVAPIADQSMGEGTTLNLPVSASDLDGDSLTLTATGLPAFCSFTDNLNNTGSLSCTPGFTDAGVYSGITVTANDGNGDAGSDSFNLTVTGVNRAPILNPIGAKAVNEGSLLSFTVSGSDSDGDSLTFSVTGTPAGASFNPVSRTFSWTPDYTQAGLYNVTFSVSDGSLTDSEVVSITVNNVNAPPVLNPIGNQTASEGGTLNVTVTASDPDGGTLTFTATGLPAFCGFTDNLNNTGTLTCSPGYTNAGTYPGLMVTVSDGVLTDSETFTLTVSGANAAPVLSPIGNQNMAEGAVLNVTITASDADGDTLTFAATGLPGFCGLTDHLNNTATLVCSPGFADAGVYSGLTVTVNDGIAGDSEGFTLAVSNVNRPPTLNPIGNLTVDEGATLNVTVTTADPDGGLLTFGATGLPGFCSFSDNLNNTGTFSCSPGFTDAGAYSGITIIVNDGALTDSETFGLTVNNVNRAPVLNPIGNQTVAGGNTLSVPVTATDPDGSALTLTATGLPSFCNFTDNLNNTGMLTCTPGLGDAGSYSGLSITASDGSLTDNETITLTVLTVLADAIFRDSFESGNLTAWSSSVGNSNLTVREDAPVTIGTKGLQVKVDGTAHYLVDTTPDAEPSYHARFYFDPNKANLGTYTQTLFTGAQGTDDLFRIQIKSGTGGTYQIQGMVLDNGATYFSTSWVTISDDIHSVEMAWNASTNAVTGDGSLILYVDGSQAEALNGIQNSTRRLEEVRLGEVATSGSVSGNEYIDDFVSMRNNAIGPALLRLNFNGTTLDTNRWTEVDTGNILKQNEKLIWASGSTTSNVTGTLNGKWNIGADFDVRVEFNLPKFAAPTGTSGSQSLRFIVSSATGSGTPDTQYRLTIARKRTTSGSFNGYESVATVGGSSSARTASATTTTGFFRFIRSGSLVSAYYWNAGTGKWVLLHSATLPAGPVLLTAEGQVSGGTAAIQMELDTLKLTIGILGTATTTRYEETNAAVSYTGTWASVPNANASGGTYQHSNTPGSTATFTFTGTGVFWIADPWNDLGIAGVYIDGVLDASVDLYSASNLYKQVVYARTGLAQGTHTIKIEVTGTKNAGSSNTLIDIDAFDVISEVATRYEETDAAVSYTGTWASASDANSSGGAYQYSNTAGSTATFTFTGTMISWISDMWNDLGKADVYIDGILDATVDLYSASNLYQQVVYTKTGLVQGSHTIKIAVTGTKNAGAAGTFIDVDAFDVTN